LGEDKLPCQEENYESGQHAGEIPAKKPNYIHLCEEPQSRATRQRRGQ
jgi:hypothetical protein